MRQKDLVEALGGVIARSTLANVEVGRENPSARLWAAICENLPGWVSDLEPWYRPGSRTHRWFPFELAGPFEIVQASYAYTFREHRAPEEIVQARQVRALSDGADGYGLRLGTGRGSFDLDMEPLWGGWIEQHVRHVTEGDSSHLTRFHFDRCLRRGQVHDFALRSWVAHDEPGDGVNVMFTRPTGLLQLSLNFLGPRPDLVWTYGPLSDDGEEEPTEPLCDADVLELSPAGTCSLRVEHPITSRLYGIAWRW